VASYGHHHLAVSKVVEDGRTSTSVAALAEGERVEEIARMLAGSKVTDTSLANARELLAAAFDPEGEGEG
jgi:DNA repair protein RecN (Recombination protein N)